MKTFSDFGITIPSGATGNVKVKCPACPEHKKASSRNDKDLSVNITEGIWNCHRCGFTGTLKTKEEKQYNRPAKIELPLSDAVIAFFKNRGINENTLKTLGITEKTEGGKRFIIFPYKRKGEWINAKYRDAEKNFRLTAGGELIIYNYDAIVGQKKVMIVEGEMDCLSVHEVGFYQVCSVPNGASKGNQRLEWLDASWQAFSESDEIIIATDNDEAGNSLKIELVRRLGKDRCREVTYPAECKDMNEVLMGFGAKGVWAVINSAKYLPVDGIFKLTDFREQLDYLFDHGFDKGATVGYKQFDELLNFSQGQLTIITGVPNSGKSAFLDQILIRLAQKEEWPIGVCSFENQPVEKHAANLSATYVGKSFFVKDRKMSADEYVTATQFLNKYFFWFKMKDEDISPEGILNRAKQLVRTQGIKALVIDPYNYMEHKRNGRATETEYISGILSDFCNFAKDYAVHVFLVAHPTKIRKNPVTHDFEVPNLYDISGSAHFFNKADNGFTVYRNRATNLVTVHVQKVRFFYNGEIGSADFNYDVYSGQYTEINDDPFQTPIPDNPRAGIRSVLPPEKEQPF